MESNANFKNLFYYNTDGQVLAASDPVRSARWVVTPAVLRASIAGERNTPQGALLRIGQQELTIVIAQPVYGTGTGWSECWPPGWT